MLLTIESTSAAVRLREAERYVAACPAGDELLLVAASRPAADDLARNLARARGATFGVHRFSLTQLAARYAAPALARRRLAPTTALGTEAVAARAVFDATAAASLSYFAPVASMPGFPRALARTMAELAF